MAGPDTRGMWTGVQSALDPTGPSAAAIARLSWVMFIGGGLIFVFVMALLACALYGPVRARKWLASHAAVAIGGVAFPVVVLSALLVYGLTLARAIVREPGEASLRIAVVGEQFWWRVRYEPETDRGELITANEIHVPVGKPVRFALTTADVIHSFWIPNLGGKLDMIPGQANTFVLQADRPGVYRGQCAEFCGGAHALMAFDVVAHAPDAFAAWVAAQQRPAIEPTGGEEQRGKDLFLAVGCGACHTVRGTPAAGLLGPDLTHVGSRRSIAAATSPNTASTVAGWIASSQHMKPSSKMPSFDMLADGELRAIAAYMVSLK